MDSPDMESSESSPIRARVCVRVRATVASREIEKHGGDDDDDVDDDDGGGGGGGERGGGLVVGSWWARGLSPRREHDGEEEEGRCTYSKRVWWVGHKMKR